MALIKCTECGKEFSDRATACPNCGCPTEIVLEDMKKSSEPKLVKDEKINEAEKVHREEVKKKIDRKDVLTEVKKMEYMLDAVQKTGVWTDEAGCNASKQLRQDLCFFTVFLGVADNGFTKQRYDFINEVLRYNLDKNDILSIVRDAEIENGKKFYDVMVECVASVILDACDAEDELRNRGMDSNICLPDKIATIFGIIGKAFLGDNCSRKERSAYADYMMNINTFLSEEGYMDNSLSHIHMQGTSFLEDEDVGDFVPQNQVQSILRVEEVFSITGRGSVVTGVVESGPFRVGDEVSWVMNGNKKSTSISGIEMFRKMVTEANVGNNVGILLKGVSRGEIKAGCVITLENA